MAVELPLFPLNAVLFPHMRMPLHIFEERYRTMLRDCREAGTTFGIVAIRDGLEVGGPAVPHAVGTLAQIHGIEDLPDGRCNLDIEGASRFRVITFSLRHAYLTGTIRYLQDAETPLDDAALLAARVSNAFTQYTQTMRTLGVDIDAALLPDEPERLSYVVAAALRVENARRQELLEIDSTALRLRRILELLRREALLLHEMSKADEGKRRAAALN
ncbi:MAG: LON peptidase substrate-binding domain-containing protein [Candidatus Dormibacteraeota bacterium]|nr:LON peptidase substrate-binding domain-containing protein [Candidatus Dormibacteraeota bacterium]MBV8445105.1 LON peptidase substrate-binding domain-containing protein [Candidatus Dormibacteraeota bacterium]